MLTLSVRVLESQLVAYPLMRPHPLSSALIRPRSIPRVACVGVPAWAWAHALRGTTARKTPAGFLRRRSLLATLVNPVRLRVDALRDSRARFAREGVAESLHGLARANVSSARQNLRVGMRFAYARRSTAVDCRSRRSLGRAVLPTPTARGHTHQRSVQHGYGMRAGEHGPGHGA